MFVLKYTESFNVQISKGQVFGNCELLLSYFYENRERSGSVVECLTQDRRASGSSLTGVTVLCP